MEILIAEDSNTSRLLLEKFLEDMDYEVISCKDGLEAWNIIKSDNAPNLLILDWMMPGMDGVEICRNLRKLPKEFYTYVLLLTERSEKENIIEGIEAGADDYIIKPFHPGELEIRLRAGIRIVKLNKELLTKINEHKQAEDRVHKFFSAVEQSSSSIVITDANGSIEYVNPKFTQLTGYTFTEAIGQNLRILKTDKTPPETHECLWKTITSGKEWHGEFCNKKKNGELYWESASISPIRNTEGVITNFIAIKDDITGRKRMEKQIISSLKEKDTLLREIYHRTKNNMQVICSLLNLQSNNSKDERLLNSFREIKNRIKSMSLVHEKLYQSKDMSRINLKSYVEDLTRSLFSSYLIDTNKILLKITAEDIPLSIDTAVPCGLAINEIISNSLKYAFPDGRGGEIMIDLHSTDNGEIELRIADNGIGMPNDFDLKKTDSLGLQIIHLLIEDQINGKMYISRENGVEYKIIFKETDLPKRV